MKKRKKSRRRQRPITLPFGYLDSSRELDDQLRLLGEVLFGITDPGFVLETDMIQEAGATILRYLRKRNSLEVCVGRLALYQDSEFKEMVRSYRARFLEWNK